MAADEHNFIHMRDHVQKPEEFLKLCSIGSCRQVASYCLSVPQLNIASGIVTTQVRFLCPRHALRFRHLEVKKPGIQP